MKTQFTNRQSIFRSAAVREASAAARRKCCGWSATQLRSSKSGNRQAFTFTELLVVLAVIAILALTLLPALARTKPTGKNIRCINNLKAWGQALQIFASENNDQPPRDGMSSSGTYPGAGTDGNHADPNAWFNLLPQLIKEKTLVTYYNDTSDGTLTYQRYPFPGGRGPVWHCPSASMTPDQATSIAGGGAEGYFSYVMNIDLKKDSTGNVVTYPTMPKLTTIPKPAATVFMFDCAFNPVSDQVTSLPQFNSVNPANRYRSFTSRHDLGGNIVFLDGHAAYFTDRYVTTGGTATEPVQKDIYWWPYRNP